MDPQSSSGFTLVEVLVALALLVVVSVGVVWLFAVSLQAGRSAHDRTIAVSIAAAKLEQLRSLEWRFALDHTGVLTARTDLTSDLSVEPVATGGPGLSESPAGTLDTNRPPYVDYLDRHGQRIGTGASPPRDAVYVRRWAVHRLSADPDRVLSLQVLVATVLREQQRPSSARPYLEWRGRPAGDDDDAAGAVTRAADGDEGFSLIEMLVATAILAIAYVVLLQLAAQGQRIARAQPEAADMRQRLRVAADMIQRDLLMAGAGLVHGSDAGPLSNYLPAVLPMRTGARRADPEVSFFDDRITILYVAAGAAAAPLVMDMPAPSADVPIDGAARGCPSTGLCGFEDGTRSLIVDTSGVGRGFDLFSVSRLSAGLVHGPPDADLSRAYPRAAARVVPVKQRVYYLDTPTRRLMAYDGYQTDVPLAENIVALRFQYFLDPWPDSVPRPPAGAGNCVYGAANPPIALLADLGRPTLAAAGATLLTDGPLCGLPPHRFDGDLLRIRRIRVTLRAQVGDHALRGSGGDFACRVSRPLRDSYVPDIAVSFDVSPRNLPSTR